MSRRVATPLPSPYSCFLARSGHFVEVGGCKKGKKEAEEKEKSGPFVASDVLLIL